jgi:pre-rRNA-processing protein TSR3
VYIKGISENLIGFPVENMNSLDCIIIRHKKENLKKCSLRGLEGREGVVWHTYPNCSGITFEECILLDMEGELLSPDDKEPLVLLDATWRYAAKMRDGIPGLQKVPRRRIPDTWKTAYPRRQTECVDPERGLASIEAMFVAFSITGRSTDGLLDHYFWKDEFLRKNGIYP